MSIRLTTASVALILLFLSQPLFAQKRPLGLDMTSTAERYGEAVGQRFSFVCPASDGGPAYVFGTDVYTDNSPICKAAIHAGALPPGVAGVVTIAIGSSVPVFRGSVRNGVTTSSYRTWPRSYSFVTGGAPGRITWDTVWSNVPAGLTTGVELECPPGGPATGSVWGTMVYAGGSAICAAAVHAGAITAARGGSIAVQRLPHSGEFVASERNGIVSLRYGVFGDAFVFSGRDAVASVVTPSVQRDSRTVLHSARSPGAAANVNGQLAPMTSGSLVDPDAADEGTLFSGKVSCSTASAPEFSATPGSVTFALNRPSNTTGYLVSRQDLGDLVTTPVTGAEFTHVAPLDHRRTYLYTITGLESEERCSRATVSVTAPRPQTPVVGASVALSGLQDNRVTLSWNAPTDRPSMFRIFGPGLPGGAGAELPVATGQSRYQLEIANLTSGTKSWEVLPVWRTPSGEMSDPVSAGSVTVIIPSMAVEPTGARTIALAGFAGSGSSFFLGPRSIQVAGFSGSGTAFLGPRTVSIPGWTANGPFPPNQGVVQ
jgi:hypothetical protein